MVYPCLVCFLNIATTQKSKNWFIWFVMTQGGIRGKARTGAWPTLCRRGGTWGAWGWGAGPPGFSRGRWHGGCHASKEKYEKNFLGDFFCYGRCFQRKLRKDFFWEKFKKRKNCEKGKKIFLGQRLGLPAHFIELGDGAVEIKCTLGYLSCLG